MISGLWSKALQVLKFDSKVNDVIYESVLSTMKEVTYEDGIMILSCVNAYVLDMAKTNLNDSIIGALKTVSGNNISVKYVEEGDKNAVISSLVSEKKAISQAQDNNSQSITDEFTFANFIVGDCNRFAQASAMAVANNPGQKQHNPLYLWGNSGLGKTHLAKAIGYEIKKNFPEKNVLYTTCESFTNAFVACMQEKNYENFRYKYRNVDVLIIDDIQFLIGKEGTQMEFFNTFEALINAGKQIVITSDKAPNNLTSLDARLTSRFQNGILMDIQPPDFETRKVIFTSKINNDHISLPDDVINYVCENVTSNVRELNGAYNILSSYLALSNGELDLDMAKKLLISIVSPNQKKLFTSDVIINAVSKYFDISPEKITGSGRVKEIVSARAIAMYICRELLEANYDTIGSYFGDKKHSTVIHSIKNVEDSEELLAQTKEIIKKLTE